MKKLKYIGALSAVLIALAWALVYELDKLLGDWDSRFVRDEFYE